MLQKIRDLMAIKDQIDIIKNNINHTSNSMDSLKSEVQALKELVLKTAVEILDFGFADKTCSDRDCTFCRLWSPPLR